MGFLVLGLGTANTGAEVETAARVIATDTKHAITPIETHVEVIRGKNMLLPPGVLTCGVVRG